MTSNDTRTSTQAQGFAKDVTWITGGTIAAWRASPAGVLKLSGKRLSDEVLGEARALAYRSDIKLTYNETWFS